MMLALFQLGLGKAKGENSESTTGSQENGKVSIVIPPARVNDVAGDGYFGSYVADMLTERMLLCNKVRVLDRSVLDAQIDEMNLSGEVIDPGTTIESGKIIGARYLLLATMQRPDIRNAKTGVALLTGTMPMQDITVVNVDTEPYAAYFTQTVNVKASVSLSARVVDLQTGEVVFMCTGNGNAQDKTKLSLEYGAENYRQTVTGRAIAQAVAGITPPLENFFNGKTERKVVGSLSGNYMNSGERMYTSGYNLYLGTQKLDNYEIASVFRGQPELYFQYRQALKKRRRGRAVGYTGIVAVDAGAFLTGVAASEHLPGFAIVGGAIGGAGLYCSAIHWPMKHRAGKKMLNQIVDSYNQTNAVQSLNRREDARTYSLAFSPMGVRFTF